MSTSSLETEIRNQTYFIKLNRPEKRNCLNFKAIESLKQLLGEIDENEKIERIVIYGEENNFCSGFDLNEVKQVNESKLIDLYSNDNWFKNNKLLIAFVQGYAIGLGFELAIACDILIADSSSKFGFLNRRFGMPCFLPLTKLRNQIGRLNAFELLDKSILINSKQASTLGLIKYHLNDENSLEETLNSIEIDNKQVKNERLRLNAKFKLNKFNGLPGEWASHNLSSSNYNLNSRHGRCELSFWNDIQKNS